MTDSDVTGEPGTVSQSKLTTGHGWFISYLLSNASSGLISPLIPLFVVIYLHASVVDVGTISSIASAAAVPALIFWGNLSDSLGKRKIFILIGFFGSFLSLLLIIITNTIGMFAVTLVLYQFLAMAATPVATLLILESTVEKKWPSVMSSFNIVSYIGLVAGLGVGTLLLNMYGGADTHFLPELYLISAFVYLGAAISALVVLPEPKKNIPRHSPRLLHLHFFKNVERVKYFPSHVIHMITFRKVGKKLAGRTKLYIFLTSFLMFGFQLFFIPFPVFVLNKLNGTETQVFVMYLLNNVASAIAFRITGRTMARIGVSRTLSMALFSRVGVLGFATVLAFALVSYSFSLPLAILCYTLMGFFWSFISISWTTSISKLAVPENRGKAIGYYNSFLGVGQIASGVLSGLVAFTFGYALEFLLAALAVLIGGILLVRFQLKMNDLIVADDYRPRKLASYQ